MNYSETILICYIFGRDLVVASPVEDYFLYIDDLPDAEKVWKQNDTLLIFDTNLLTLTISYFRYHRKQLRKPQDRF